MEFKDYYAVLGVDRKASQDEIQRAYRKLARKLHPDVNKGPDADARFKEIGEAYEVLKDPEKRVKYDRYGAAWKAREHGTPPPPGYEDVRFDFDLGDLGGFGGGGSGFSSFFEMLFGSGARARRPQAAGPFGFEVPFDGGRGGGDQEATIALPLESAITGGKQEIALTEPGTGERRTYTVNIPPGVRPGGRIRLRGKGAPSRGNGPRGDLYLRVEVLPHPRYRLEGNDLRTTLEVSPWEAALGGQVTLDTLQGRLGVRIPPGSSSGRLVRLRGQGFPTSNGERGDLLAEIKIVVPETLSASERELFEKLAATSEFRARAGT